MTAGRRTPGALVALLATALLSLAGSAQQAVQNPRIALVIGNATYRDAALATTANDAGLVAQTLQAAGFDVVGARDLDGQSLRTAFRDFLDKASAAGPEMQAFVYLAGRGVQYDGDNYFVPVDAQINRDADVPIDALRISDFAHALAQTPGKARIIVLDAARANPYASQGSPLAPGLALVDPEPGQLVAYNAAPGTLAGDEQGPYGVFGKTLAGAMRQGGVDVVEVFDQTRVTVNQLTQGALLPWSAAKLTEPYYIFERAADAPPPAAPAAANQSIVGLSADTAYAVALQSDTIRGYEEYLSHFSDSAQAPRVRAILAALREAYFWRRSVNTNTAHAYWTYLRRYPKGPHLADARRRLAMISAAYEPPPDFQPMTYQDLPPPPQDEGFYEEQPVYAFDAFGPPPLPPPPEYYQQYYYVEDDDWRDLPPPPPPVDVGFLPVLAIGIPLVVGAVGFQHYEHYHRDGIAPAGLPRFRPPPPAPPPLPRNVNPVQPPPPVPVRVTGPASGHVKPLPPIGPPAGPAAKPAAAPTPAPSPGGKTPAGTPAVTAPLGGKPPAAAIAPLAPGAPAPEGKPQTPAPVAPALGKPPTVTPGAPAALPGAPVATPGGKPPAAVIAPPGAKPLPVAPALGNPPTVTPGAPAALPGAPVATPGGKPPAAVIAPPGAKPLPVAPNIATPSSGVSATPLSGKAPGVVTPPAGAKPPASTLIAPTPAKPSPVPPPPAATPNTIAKPLPKPPGPAPAPAVNLAPKPAVNPPSIAPAVPKAAPAIVHAPSPAPPVVHAPPPPPLVRPPPPVVHAAPPPPVVHAAPPPPVVHAAPPPVVHAAPPPPVVHAPPPPVVRPPPAAQHAPLCGKPGLPPCPK
jgi:uncharacterized caspase-like protein